MTSEDKKTSVTFKLLSTGDGYQLHRWLQLSHIREFWDDGDRTIEQVNAHYMLEDDTSRYLFYIDHEPVGYIQSYLVNHHHEYYQFLPSEKKIIGIDFFIGDQRFLGKGLSTVILDQFILLFCHTADQILVDPEVRNQRSIQIYHKIGFVKKIECNLHDKLYQLMLLDLKSK